MNRNLGIGLFLVGILLMVFGLLSADSLSSDISNFFTGTPTSKAIWLMVGGIILTIWGVASFTRSH